MKCIDLTLPTPAENLAGDEALLDECEAGTGGETLRFWQPEEHFVVAGYANRVAREVNVPACQDAGIPIFRRCTGGGTVLQGPGCLNYSLILKITETGPLRSIASANDFIMRRQQQALAPLLPRPVEIQGCTDLAIDDLKFSGNAQRRRRHFLIFHGTFLLQFDLGLIEKYLLMPSQQPAYRHARPHSEFLTNLQVSPAAVKAALRQAWGAHAESSDLPLAKFPDLLQKYSTDAWNFKF